MGKLNFADFLKGYRPFDGIIKNIDKTPMSVAGIVDSAQPQLIAAVSAATGGNTLIVTYSDMEARTASENLKLYTDNVMVFPSKEYVFYNIETMGRANENARLSVLDALVDKKNVTVVASIDSLMTYTADKQRFCRSIINIEPGDVYDPWKLLHLSPRWDTGGKK